MCPLIVGTAIGILKIDNQKNIMDRGLSHSEVNKGRALSILKYVIIIGALFALLWRGRGFLKKSGDREDFYTVSVERGDIRNTLTATGTVVPSVERQINAPVSTEIKRVVKSTGEFVESGDLILELNQEFTKLAYKQLADELKLRRNNVDKLKLEYDKNLRDLDYQNQIKSLQLEELTTQVKDQKRLNEVGGATAKEVEQAELPLKVAQLEKKMLENELSYQPSYLQ